MLVRTAGGSCARVSGGSARPQWIPSTDLSNEMPGRRGNMQCYNNNNNNKTNIIIIIAGISSILVRHWNATHQLPSMG